jgi:hypothetical protein
MLAVRQLGTRNHHTKRDVYAATSGQLEWDIMDYSIGNRNVETNEAEQPELRRARPQNPARLGLPRRREVAV